MRIPKKIKVGGHIYKILLVDRNSFDENGIGEYLVEKNIIKISKDLPQNQRELTFFHEVLHALNNQLEEKDVEFLAQGIYQVLSDNKMLN